jgi:hypothetical protein
MEPIETRPSPIRTPPVAGLALLLVGRAGQGLDVADGKARELIEAVRSAPSNAPVQHGHQRSVRRTVSARSRSALARGALQPCVGINSANVTRSTPARTSWVPTVCRSRWGPNGWSGSSPSLASSPKRPMIARTERSLSRQSRLFSGSAAEPSAPGHPGPLLQPGLEGRTQLGVQLHRPLLAAVRALAQHPELASTRGEANIVDVQAHDLDAWRPA